MKPVCCAYLIVAFFKKEKATRLTRLATKWMCPRECIFLLGHIRISRSRWRRLFSPWNRDPSKIQGRIQLSLSSACQGCSGQSCFCHLPRHPGQKRAGQAARAGYPQIEETETGATASDSPENEARETMKSLTQKYLRQKIQQPTTSVWFSRRPTT